MSQHDVARRDGPHSYDVAAVVAAVDLRELADELLGSRSGSARSPTWPCPNPDHPQTGRTPPVTMFTGRDGIQRWHCHGCGNGGDAITLVRQVQHLAFGDAVEHLAGKVGVEPVRGNGGTPPRRPATPTAPRHPVIRPAPALTDYVNTCARRLWKPDGAVVRRWLTDARGLPEDILRVNHVGADVGDHTNVRPPGLPEVRAAAVLPVLVDGRPSYLQLRVLGAQRRQPKYLNPSSELAPNPRIGYVEPAQISDRPLVRRELIITEGIIDALSATAAGYRAAAVLGASYAYPAAAELLAARPEQLVVAFDPDPAGRAGRERLAKLLANLGRAPGVMVLRNGDLNQCLRQSGDWDVELAGRVQHATAQIGQLPPRSLGRTVA